MNLREYELRVRETARKVYTPLAVGFAGLAMLINSSCTSVNYNFSNTSRVNNNPGEVDNNADLAESVEGSPTLAQRFAALPDGPLTTKQVNEVLNALRR